MKKLFFSLVAGALVFGTALAAEADKATQETLMLQSKQAEVTVSLPGNATTGYRWYLTRYDANLLSLAGADYVTDNSKPGLVGVGGVQHFYFKPTATLQLAPQVTKVGFTYMRGWQPQASDKRVIVSIVSNDSQMGTHPAAGDQDANQISLPAMQTEVTSNDNPSPSVGKAAPANAHNWLSLPKAEVVS